MNYLLRFNIYFIYLFTCIKISSSFDLVEKQQKEMFFFTNYLDDFFDLLNKTLNDLSLNQTESVNCFQHIKYAIEKAVQREPWALKMFDSMGKPSSGIMQAGLSFLGFYSECIDTTNDLFNGQYCLSTINLPKSTFQTLKKFSGSVSNTWSNVQPRLGICAPSTCSIDQISLITNKIFSKLIEGSSASFSSCYEKDLVQNESAMFFICYTLLSLIVGLVLIATIYDYWLINLKSKLIANNNQNLNVINKYLSTDVRKFYLNETADLKSNLTINISKKEYNEYSIQKNLLTSSLANCQTKTLKSNSLNNIFTISNNYCKNKHLKNYLIQLHVEEKIEENFLIKFLLCFSAIKNTRKLFETNQPFHKTSTIDCLQGLKFYSMIWIIIGHSYSFAMQWLFFRNPNQIKISSQDLLSQVFANGTFSVDIFFFISGLLVCLNGLKFMKKSNGKLNLIFFYLYRYLRIAPLMIILIAFCSTILSTIGEGPVWSESIVMYDGWCKKNWWINVLHLHNFINTDKLCLSHSWYSAVDMQFYIISPIILIPLYKRPKLGLTILFGLLAASITIIATLTAINDYPAVPYVNGNVSLNVLNGYYRNIYIKPYTRVGPYLVGIFLGYLIYKKKAKLQISNTIHIAFCIASSITILAILLSMHGANNGIKPSTTIASLYSSTSRSLFSICLAYFVTCFINGKLKFINTLLSLNVIKPFTQVSYSAYLIHPIIIAAFYGSREQVFIFSHYLMFYFAIGNLVLTYVLSFLVSIAFELPFINLSKLILTST